MMSFAATDYTARSQFNRLNIDRAIESLGKAALIYVPSVHVAYIFIATKFN